MVDSPFDERRRRIQDGISRIQNVAAVEIVFRGAPGCFRGTWVYIGGRSRSVELRVAHEGGGVPRGQAPPCLTSAASPLDDVCSIWTLFDIPFLRNTQIGKNNNLHWALG